MYYNTSTSTDDYVNDFLEEILHTGFHYDVPYKIDMEKYESLLKKHGTESALKGTDTLTFSCSCCNSEEDFSFFASTPDGNDDSPYDCVYFSPDDRHTTGDIQHFLHQITECILQPSTKHIIRMKKDIYDSISKELSHLKRLDHIISRS